MKHPFKTFSMILLLLALLALPGSAAMAQDSNVHAVVQVAALNVRQGPGTNYSVITVAMNGDDLTLVGTNPAGWYQVQFSDGRTGWIIGTPSYTTISGDTGTLPVVAAPAAPAGSTLPRPVPASTGRVNVGNTIVFQTSSGGAIYAVNADGSNLRFLTNGIDPAISPDGRLVAFTRWDSSNNGATGALWVIGVDGSGERMLMNQVHQPKAPTWSPDGQQIIFNLQQGGLVGPDLTCVKPGSHIPSDAGGISFQDDGHGGKLLCYQSNPWWGLRLLNVADGTWRDLPRDLHSFSPTWNPGKSWHVVYRGDSGLVNLDINRDATWALSTDPEARSPAFSPDGSKLALSYHQHDHWEVHVMDMATSADARLTDTDPQVVTDALLNGQDVKLWNSAAPSWSPDGSKIAFVTDRTGQWEIWVMNADGSSPHPLLSKAALSTLPAIQYNGVDERVISWR